jgi:RNA polymerase sigma-70 factor (ECF subfamily)
LPLFLVTILRLTVFIIAEERIELPEASRVRYLVQSQTELREWADPDAQFEEVFRAQWPRLCSLLTRLTGSRAEAEDLALETFWRLYQRREQVLRASNPAGWLYRVGTNLGLNALRAKKRRTIHEQAASRHLLGLAGADSPPAALERLEERELVRAVLARLSERSAQMLMLRGEGLSYAQIATALDLRPTSVGTLLARAEKEFEKHFRAVKGR